MNREKILNKLNVACVVAVLALSPGHKSRAQAPTTNSVSQAFAEFLLREGVRDPETGAILSVRPKVPRFHGNPPLTCSIRKLAETNRTSRYEIVLTARFMTGPEEHEKLVLDAEPALLVEVSRQANYQALAPERARRLKEAKTKRISEMSNGLLAYGMSKEQVVAAKGAGWKQGDQYQKAGAFEMRYADVTLFLDPVLVDIYPAGEPVLGEPSPKPVPLVQFEQQHKR
jgi:hypothetical protein